ncbi:GNAT family N-acetyltransferase [Bacillus sp. CGMCC 1.16607]|uniref:GNAT family N-acetyltransferase n=1 Tax=Bacillus sp. CGMCC 1.16607 TaxID=3351842 RepID=UPI00364396AD
MALSIHNFKPEFLQGVKALYQSIINKDPNSIFWWPGETEFSWEYCLCAFEGENLVGKGQVQPINVQQPGTNEQAKHAIYLNIKLHPEYENNHEIFNKLYEALYEKALLIKNTLPSQFETALCVGNAISEQSNNQLFEAQGFVPFNYLYEMETDLTNFSPPISSLQIEGLSIDYWKMETEQAEQDYLKVESIIWPENALTPGRLKEYKEKQGWRAITAVYQNEIIGSVMCWEENNSCNLYGVIEDLFVLPEWRKKGIAKALLLKALTTLKNRELQKVELMVLVENSAALSLYEQVGFSEIYKEVRYSIPLVANIEV